MFYEKQLEFMQSVFKKCRLNLQIVDISNPNNSEISLEYSKFFFKDKSLIEHLKDIDSNTIYRAKDMFWCRYIYLKLPTENHVLVIGPYLNIDISHQQIIEQIETLKIPIKYLKELELYYSSIPIIKEENSIYAIISTFAEHIWNNDNFEYTDVNVDKLPIIIDFEFDEKSNSNNSLFSIHSIEKRYEYENDIIKAVSEGNIHKAEFLISFFSSLSFEKRTGNELRNIKNYCIIMNTILRKAAEQGGVHPVHIDAVSSEFARKIETLSSVSKASDFMREILQTYCRLVKNNNIKNYSPLIQKAIVYIDNDVTNDLSLSAISKISNVSAGYFSNLFKKETGITLTEYVNQQRIKLAKHMLRNSNLQIQTIAQHCGILDLHYFCRLFKKITGKTPTEYKNDLTLS